MPYKGSDVVKKHKAVVDRCKETKVGWDLLACIVDEMHKEYKG
ncbi:MAG: hypothetical protein QXN17_03845 [Nitrososphaerota archaeon]